MSKTNNWKLLWRWEGTASRKAYCIAGILLAWFKFVVDSIVTTVVFGREWHVYDYIASSEHLGLVKRGTADFNYYATMLVISMPFMWVGVCMTLQRLRDAELPGLIVAAFFVPIINLLMFLVLCIIPSPEDHTEDEACETYGSSEIEQAVELNYGRRAHRGMRARLISMVPSSDLGQALFAMIAPLAVGFALTLFSVNYLRSYGWGLFVGLPFYQAITAVILFSIEREREQRSSVLISVGSVALYGVVLLVAGFEGMVCIVMASPIILVVSMLAGLIGHSIAKCLHPQHASTIILLLAVGLPILMGAEAHSMRPLELRRVESSVDIAASDGIVWQHVVAFPPITTPPDLLFRTGIACPLSARIDGQGVGAVRHCVFTTGAFVEPITNWDEPRRLAFDVVRQPLPLKEWSFYADLHPPHLDSFLVSRRGEFRLDKLPDGGTRLTGATWYENKMWPSWYWAMWSDAIIHRIHLRVLDHIRDLSERSHKP
jgi:uncharacterized membrane protein YhaH (DUF805 family)